MCGKEGWSTLAAVIDTCTREIVGFRISKSGKAKTAEAALQEGIIYRFRYLQKLNNPITLRSDNGLVFTSKSFTKTVKDYNFEQEFITPYTPEQNGMIERFFRTIKEECIWHHNFSSLKRGKRHDYGLDRFLQRQTETLCAAVKNQEFTRPYTQVTHTSTIMVNSLRFQTEEKKMAVGIFYGSSSGATEEVARMIQEALGVEADLINIAEAKPEDFDRYDKIILGSSTWGDGDLQDDWEDFFDEFKKIDLTGKTVALFGLGDQEEYPDTFVDAMGILYKQALKNGAEIVGSGWPSEEYDFDESTAFVDNAFVGLAIDEDNQENLTSQRVHEWVNRIREFFI